MRQIRGIAVVIAFIAFAVTTGDADKKKTDSVINVELDDLELKIDRKSTFALKDVPTEIRRLHGRRVRLHGYMYPSFKEFGLTKFLFNSETRKKSFLLTTELERVPVHFLIPVSLRAGTTTDYSQKPIAVEGRFVIRAEMSEGTLIFVYRIDDATVVGTKPRPGYHSSLGFGC